MCPKHESVRKVCLKAMKAVQSSSVPDRLSSSVHLVGLQSESQAKSSGEGWCIEASSIQPSKDSGIVRLRQNLLFVLIL